MITTKAPEQLGESDLTPDTGAMEPGLEHGEPTPGEAAEDLEAGARHLRELLGQPETPDFSMAGEDPEAGAGSVLAGRFAEAGQPASAAGPDAEPLGPADREALDRDAQALAGGFAPATPRAPVTGDGQPVSGEAQANPAGAAAWDGAPRDDTVFARQASARPADARPGDRAANPAGAPPTTEAAPAGSLQDPDDGGASIADGPKDPDLQEHGQARPADPADGDTPVSADMAARISGESLLKGLGLTRPVASAEKPRQVAPAAPDISEAAQAVVDNILVSPPSPGETAQVRLMLKDSVLDGAEVQISRNEGKLCVQFVAKTERAAAYISTNAPELKSILHDRLDDEVQVDVVTDGLAVDTGDAVGYFSNTTGSNQQETSGGGAGQGHKEGS